MTGAILAGGKATRFDGQPKGLLSVAGVRIVDRIRSALEGIVDEVVVISNDPDARFDSRIGRVVRDVRPPGGSLVGIHTALATASDDVLVVAWDMPFVTAELLAMIKGALEPGVDAVIPVTDRPQPLCAAYAQRCLPFLAEALDAGNLRVMDFVASLPFVRKLGRDQLAKAGDPERLFFNANTPDALARAEEMARGR